MKSGRIIPKCHRRTSTNRVIAPQKPNAASCHAQMMPAKTDEYGEKDARADHARPGWRNVLLLLGALRRDGPVRSSAVQIDMDRAVLGGERGFRPRLVHHDDVRLPVAIHVSDLDVVTVQAED